MRRLLRRAALLAGVAAITAWAWLGYGTTDSRLALSALWSVCAPPQSR